MNDLVTRNLFLVLEEQHPATTCKGFPPSYRFAILIRETSERIGQITVRVGNDAILREYAGHISYEIVPEHRGNRFAAEACAAIIPFAESLGIHPVRVTCDPENLASARTCELCGGVLLGIVAVPPGNYAYENGARLKLQYEFPRGTCRTQEDHEPGWA